MLTTTPIAKMQLTPIPNTRGQLYAISPSELDVLQYFIDRLHGAARRVEVHAWCTTYNTWNRATAPASSNHVYNAHPEWITKNKAGTTYTYADDAPLDPGIPEVQDYLVNVFMDIVRNYDVDGVHFDYIRLLGPDSGYNPTGKARFLAQTGWNYDTQNAAGQLDEVYEAWRRDQISKVVQRVHTLTLLEKPWVEVSAFLVNFDDSVEMLGQGYNWWVAHNAIDVLHPGCYSSTVSGTQDDWNFYVSKLAQNGDAAKVPMVCAIGDYLLTATMENASAVDTLRLNSRKPDGFNFFDYGSMYTDGSAEHANNLFNTGGPMDNWAPVPPIPQKTDEETIPPNPPAGAAVVLVGGIPRVSFNRPASASDGNLPVHYRLYRDSVSPVRKYYANMAMEWWDLASARASFSFDDSNAPTGTCYYAVAAYDHWNNEAVATLGPITATGGDYVIESGSTGQHNSDYSESGTFSSSTSHSSATGCTSGIGSRFALPADANGRADKARFAPSGLASGTYAVYVTCYNYSSANALGVTVRKNDAGGQATSAFDLTTANAGSKWAQVATISFTAGAGHFIEFDNATQTNLGDTTNARMNPDAVKFQRIGRAAKEPKPPITPPVVATTQVIVDSHPQSLDYDDAAGTAAWQSSSLAGYYNGNARYYSSSNYPVNSVAVWVVDLPQAGKWAIDGWVRHNTSFAQQAQYRFADGTGTVRNVTTTQRSTYDSTTAGDWLINVDGVSDASAYSFQQGRVYITLYGNGSAGSQTLVADALRFRLVTSDISEWSLY